MTDRGKGGWGNEFRISTDFHAQGPRGHPNVGFGSRLVMKTPTKLQILARGGPLALPAHQSTNVSLGPKNNETSVKSVKIIQSSLTAEEISLLRSTFLLKNAFRLERLPKCHAHLQSDIFYLTLSFIDKIRIDEAAHADRRRRFLKYPRS